MSKQCGAALSETLVGLLAILPAFWAMDYLGRLHDMQRSSVAGARYAAWEETVGRGADPSLSDALQDRIHGNDRVGLVSHQALRRLEPSDNPLWHDRLDSRHPESAPPPRRAKPDQGDDLPAAGIAVRNIAHGESVPALAGLGGLSGRMLGLRHEDLPTHTVSLTAAPRLEHANAARPVRLKAGAAISAGFWQAVDDREYQRRAERIVASEPVNAISQPAQQLGRFFVFKEGRYAESTDFIPPSRIIPSRR